MCDISELIIFSIIFRYIILIIIIYTDILKEIQLIIGYTFSVYCCKHVLIFTVQTGILKSTLFLLNIPLLSVYLPQWSTSITSVSDTNRRYFDIRREMYVNVILLSMVNSDFITSKSVRQQVIFFPFWV